jgi:hypothetical protein
MPRKSWIILGSVLTAVVVAVVVVVIAVGGGGDDSATPAGAPPGFGAASQELQDCLAEQGVDPSMGGPGQSPGAPSTEMQKAFEACQRFMPDPPSGGDLPAPPDGEGGFSPPTG